MTDTRFKRIEKKKTQELISYDHSVWKDIKKELFSNKDCTGEYHHSPDHYHSFHSGTA